MYSPTTMTILILTVHNPYAGKSRQLKFPCCGHINVPLEPQPTMKRHVFNILSGSRRQWCHLHFNGDM